MPQQTSVNIADNGDGTATVTIGPWGYTKPVSFFFDRSYDDEDQIRRNAKLAYQIGGKPHPASAEYLNAVNNGQHGMEGRKSTLFILKVELEDEDSQTFRVTYGPNKNTQLFGIPVTLAQLEDDTPDDDLVLQNIAVFLRKAGYGSFSQGAINAVNAQRFWR